MHIHICIYICVYTSSLSDAHTIQVGGELYPCPVLKNRINRNLRFQFQEVSHTQKKVGNAWNENVKEYYME